MTVKALQAVGPVSGGDFRGQAGSRGGPRRKKEDRLPKGNRAIRRKILIKLFKHLQSAYNLELTPDVARDLISFHAGVDALFSFRSDSHLDDLRGALLRLESGKFGICIACKQPIAREDLNNDITMRVCPFCETEFNRRRPEADVPASSPRKEQCFVHALPVEL